ncbi:MAG: hypothetical protein V3V21_04005 [Thermoplasmata archaeon]
MDVSYSDVGKPTFLRSRVVLIGDLRTVSWMLADVAMFLLVFFMVLAAILRDDFHHWVRVSLVAFGAVVLLYFLSAVYGVGP